MTGARQRTEFRTLSPAMVLAHLDAFLEIASDVEGEYWERENFLCDLPEKWSLSFAAWAGDRVLGYAILSRREPDRAHLHHLMIGRSHRRQGLGTAMVGEMENRSRHAGCGRLTLKVGGGNPGAQRLYRRLGYKVVESENAYLLFEKTLGPADAI